MTDNKSKSISKESFHELKALLASMVECSTKEDKMICKRYKEEIEAFLIDFVGKK